MGSCNSRNDRESGKTVSLHEKAQYASVPTTSDDVIESDTESPGNEERNGLLLPTEKEIEDVPWDIDSILIPKYFKPKLIADLKTRLSYIQERYHGVVHVDVIWKLQKMTGIAFIYRMKDFNTGIYHWDDVPKNFLFHGPSDTGRLSVAEDIAFILHNFRFLLHKEVIQHVLYPEKCYPTQNAAREVKRQWDMNTEKVLLLDIKKLGKHDQMCYAVADELARLINNMEFNKAITVILDATMEQIDRMSLHSRDFENIFCWRFPFGVLDPEIASDVCESSP